MKTLVNLLLALLLLSAIPVGILAQTDEGKETKPKTPTKEETKPKPDKPAPHAPGRNKTPPAGPPKVIVVEHTVPAKPLSAELTINSLPGATVQLNNEKKQTDNRGYLTLPSLKPGDYKLTVSKLGYRDYTSTIRVEAGRSNLANAVLTPLPGSLSVRPNVAGASIELAGPSSGSFINQVVGQPLPAGQYQLKVSKSGYKTDVRSFEVKPAEPVNLSITLNPVTPAEMLSQCEYDFRERHFRPAIEGCAGILAAQPNHARANTLIGLSYYYSEKYVEGLDYLSKAISLGEAITLPVKHHHKALMDDNLCSGVLSFSGGRFSFTSQVGGHDFNVPIGKLAAVRFEPQKAGRISADVLLPKGSKEEKKVYNFHASRAFIRQYQADSSLMVVDCNSCQEETELLYQLLVRSRQMPAPINRAAQTTQPSQSNISSSPTTGTAAAPPSGFRTWGQKSFQLNYPATWVTALEQTDSIVLAPQQALTQVRGQMNHTHGVNAGVMKMPDVPGATLATVSESFILSILTGNPHLQRRDQLRPVRLSGREALTITLSGFSNVSKRNETVTVYTTALRNREFFYLLTVAPMEDLASYQTIFQTILNSVQFKD